MTPAEAKAEERSLRSLFSSIDVDGDGRVTKRELQSKLKADSAVQDLLKKAGGSEDYVMDQLDVDGDGFVTYAEFEAMLSADAGKLVEAVLKKAGIRGDKVGVAVGWGHSAEIPAQDRFQPCVVES